MRMSTIPREFSGSIQNADGEWGPYQTVGAHAVDRARILQGLIEAADRPTVAVTHAPPLAEAADLYRDSPIPWWAPGSMPPISFAKCLPNCSHQSGSPGMFIVGTT